MLKIHATKKLFAKLPVDDEGLLPGAISIPLTGSSLELLSDWTATLMTIERRQCVLFVHHQTRFPVFIPAVRKPDMKNLESMFADVFLNSLLKLGVSQDVFEPTADSIGSLQFDSNTNRSVLGTMNQYKRALEWICPRYDLDETMGYAISAELAHQFCGMSGRKDYFVPATEMALLLGESEEVAGKIGMNNWHSLVNTPVPDDVYYLVLKHYLDRYASDHGISNLPELHGFLTGVLLCQRVVLPSEWIPALWGGEEHSPEWESIEEATDFQSALMSLYNEIAEALVIGVEDFEPLFAKYQERPDREYSAPWCYGFLHGVRLDDDGINWSKGAQMGLAAISLPFDPKFADDFDAEDDIIEEHCQQVLLALRAIHHFTRGFGSPSSATANVVPFRREAKVGRNETCPCGSGKKYKKCCLVVN